MVSKYIHKKQRAKLALSSLPIGDTPVQFLDIKLNLRTLLYILIDSTPLLKNNARL